MIFCRQPQTATELASYTSFESYVCLDPNLDRDRAILAEALASKTDAQVQVSRPSDSQVIINGKIFAIASHNKSILDLATTTFMGGRYSPPPRRRIDSPQCQGYLFFTTEENAHRADCNHVSL